MTRTPDDLVRMEVLACVSSLVATLAGGYGQMENAARMRESYKTAPGADLSELTEQAFELATPVDDWEEAALEHGARFGQMTRADNPEHGGKYIVRDAPEGSDMAITFYDDRRYAAIAYCDYHDIEPYQREVFEHWIVSDWLADKLEAEGEKVDKDFAGLCIWARTTTGQMIAADGVIERIAAKPAEG